MTIEKEYIILEEKYIKILEVLGIIRLDKNWTEVLDELFEELGEVEDNWNFD